jgi:protoporphyrinogen oxidase|tara:strand:- start:22 stop:1347 length:1326 start_codon:yes stop_codon:yes gene_type:complete
MNIILLGGGIASISLSYFLQNNKNIENIHILEKENKIGGLLRSYKFGKIFYDVGPHIIFSKDKKNLKTILNLLGKNKAKIRRSNKIIFNKKILIKYPFENELHKLPKLELEYALKMFLNNRYKKIKPKNMKQFFLKIFGEGILKLYLEPYNNKIWKYPISKMDTQIVARIPKPPNKDIINSAKGIDSEGYKHQLHFNYPVKGGIESLFNSFKKKLNKKIKIYTNQNILKINKNNEFFIIQTDKKKFKSEMLISTIPLNYFYKLFHPNKKTINYSNNLKYNSIYISVFKIKGNVGGNNFAFMIPDRDIIFHRISKLNFLGKNYYEKNYSFFEIEITFRKGSKIDKLNKHLIINRIISGLFKINFIKKRSDIHSYVLNKFEYAYVIYNLEHRKSVDSIINYYNKCGVKFLGRWGTWEYLNSDQVIKNAKILSEEIINEIENKK